MNGLLADDPLRPGTVEEAAVIRAALSAAGFVSEISGGGSGPEGPASPDVCRRLPDGLDPTTTLATLLTMWQLGESVQPMPRRSPSASTRRA